MQTACKEAFQTINTQQDKAEKFIPFVDGQSQYYAEKDQRAKTTTSENKKYLGTEEKQKSQIH